MQHVDFVLLKLQFHFWYDHSKIRVSFEYGSTEQFEKNYRSARGPRETFATNWLPGYPRATVLRTCSPLLRRRNFVKSLELLRIMRTTSLSLSLETFVNFELFPIVSTSVSLVIRIWNDACRNSVNCCRLVWKWRKEEKKIQWHYYRGKKGRMGYSPLR